VSAGRLELLLLASVALGGAAVALMLMRHWPRLAVIAWVSTICFVPYWAGVTVKVFVPPSTMIAVLVVAAIVPVRGFRFHIADMVPTLLLVGFLIAAFTGASSLTAGFTLMVEWIPAYVVGRLLATSIDVTWIYGVIAVAFSVVAVLAILEFLTKTNLFVGFAVPGPKYSLWGVLQVRGGELRAETAFGHSIALGASLALAIPCALGSRFRQIAKLTMVALMLAASVLTFSRLGMVSAVFGLVLCVVFLRNGMSRRERLLVSAILVAAAAAAVPFISTVFDSAGTEATGSADYRGGLLSTVDAMNPLGLASSYERSPTGEVFFSGFRSIDSALILIGLTFGLLALGLIIIALAAAVVTMLRGRATPATIAVVAQIPVLTSVALITQYAAFAWFMVGLAATSQMIARDQRRASVAAADGTDGAAPDADADGAVLVPDRAVPGRV
jgi:hypothetical protein